MTFEMGAEVHTRMHELFEKRSARARRQSLRLRPSPRYVPMVATETAETAEPSVSALVSDATPETV